MLTGGPVLALVVFAAASINTSVFVQSVEAGVVAQQTPERIELEFWRAIKDSTDPDEFQAYLDAYPQGKFAAIARIRVKSLRKTSAPAPASTAAPAPAPAPAKTKPKPKAVAAPAKVAPSAGTGVSLPPGVYRDCGQCPEMVDMPSGQFNMGSTDDPSSSPVRAVSIDYSFAVARAEVTVGQWALCVAEGGCRENSRHAGIQVDRPAINLSWEDANDYVTWLSEYTGRSYRMLSEAEWEFAARGGTANDYWWGSATANGLSDCRDCGGEWDKNAPQGPLAFPSNGFGVHGTSGGAQEWVMDCWSDNHENATGNGTAVLTASCTQRVLKGGSWRSKLPAITSYSRSTYEASVRYVTNGVRVALDNAELPPLVEN